MEMSGSPAWRLQTRSFWDFYGGVITEAIVAGRVSLPLCSLGLGGGGRVREVGGVPWKPALVLSCFSNAPHSHEPSCGGVGLVKDKSTPFTSTALKLFQELGAGDQIL